MKKLFLFLLIFLCQAKAMNFEPETYDLNFQTLRFNTGKFSDAFCDFINLKNNNLSTKCEIHPSSLAYHSPEDQTVFLDITLADSLVTIYLYRSTQLCENPFNINGNVSGTKGTLPFSEVLFAELMRLQRYGYLENPADSLEAFLKNEMDKMKGVGGCPDIEMITYFENSGAKSPIGPGCCSLVESSTAIRSLRLQKNEKPFAHKLTGNVFRIEGVPEHAAYRLFDLNGKLLQTGKLSGMSLKIPTLPAILEIGGKSILVKQ